MLSYTATPIYQRTSTGKLPAGYVPTVRDESGHVVQQFQRVVHELLAHTLCAAYIKAQEKQNANA